MSSREVAAAPVRVTACTDGARYPVPHEPGLDGVRGLAVLAVLAYHLDLPWAGGGFLGVEVFFALSGFLVTQLLVAELRLTGRLDVGAFARARARRLLPALLACVMGTLTVAHLLLPTRATNLRWDALASLAYVQNWQLAFGGMPYSEAFARPSPFLHIWSLSVEGQLYLVWPVLFVSVLTLLSRWTTVALTLALAWLSAVAMAQLYSPDDGGIVYYLTPARASGFLVGAALAIAWCPEAWSRRLPLAVEALLDAAGITALVTILVSFCSASEFDSALYEHGGFLRTGLVTAVLVAAATRGRTSTATLMSCRPIAAAGRRSYGLYLYHWPVFVLGRGLPGPGWLRDTTWLALTLALTEASYRLLETPVRRGGLRTLGRRLGLPRMTASAAFATATGIAVAVALSTATPQVGPPGAGPAGTTVADAAAPAVDGDAGSADQPVAEAAAPTPDPALDRSTPEPTGSAAPAPAGPGAAPTLVVGDSIALGSRDALRTALGGQTTVDAKVGRQFAASPAIVAAWTQGHDGPIVLALGANGTVSPRDVRAVLSSAGQRRVVLIGTAVPRRWKDGNNAVLRDAADRHRGQVAFVDWAALVADHPGVLGPDGVHPGPAGRRLLARAVGEALRT